MSLILLKGKMGTAILRGFLSYYKQAQQICESPAPVQISHIVVTVRQPSEANRIVSVVHSIQGPTMDGPVVSVWLQDSNEQAARQSDIVILACKPTAFDSILRDNNMRSAIFEEHVSKIVVSIVGGVSIAQLKQSLYNVTDAQDAAAPSSHCTIVRVIPNIAASMRESMTIVSMAPNVTEDEAVKRISELFSQLGPVIQLPESQFNNASALASSSIAFYARIISLFASGDGSETAGEPLSPKDALRISAQAARGASSLILEGEDPQHILSQVATKGGSTQVGLRVMEDSHVPDALITAISECAEATAMLSKVEQK